MGKLINIENINQICEHLNSRIGLIQGTFNTINSEQISYLEKAKQLVDTLVVGVFSDNIARKICKENKPIHPDRDRALFLSAFEFIDYVYIEKNTNSNHSNLALHFNLDKIIKKSLPICFEHNGLTSSIFKKIQMNDYRSIYNRLINLSKNSNCMIRSVAALIVKDDLILSDAYNHTSKYMKCERTEPLAENKKKYNTIPEYPCSKYEFICRANHAEQVAIFKALNCGIQLENATLYVTTSPCLMCAHAIFLSGISKVISFGNHIKQDGADYLKLNHVEYKVIEFN